MKIKLLLLFLLLSPALYAQQYGVIKGRIKTSNGQPASLVAVTLKGTTKGTTTDSNGDYEIRDVAAGTYTLVASFIGLETKTQQVRVIAGEATEVPDILLAENSQQLNEIVISDSRANPFDRKQSEFVAKLPLKNIENPQVYNTVSAELLKDQVVTNFDDALKNATGVEKLWESTGRGGDGAGYFSMRGFSIQPTMVNGLPGLTNGSLDPANIERIEVIKGPSGTLFGSSLISYGGLINTVTKKPYETFGGEITYVAGSFGLNRVAADINVPLNEAVAVRVNTAYHSENSFQDAGFKNSFFIAPALSYQVNDRLSFWINAEFLSAESTNPTMLFLNRSESIQFANLNELNYNPKLSLTSNDITIKNPRYNLQAQMLYKLSEQWTSQTAISRGSARADGYYSYLWDNGNGKGEFGLMISDQNGQTSTTDIQQNFLGDFQIGTLRNRVVVGVDYFHRNLMDNSSREYQWFYNVTPQGELNFVNPKTEVEVVRRDLSRQAVDALFASADRRMSNSKDEAYSAYISDVINIMPALSAMASLRLDYFRTEGDITTNDDDYDQTALSPKFGLVYQPLLDKLAVFANYMNGFKNLAPQPVEGAGGEGLGLRTYKPEHANQFEAGVKTSLLADRLSVTASYYDIRVSNKLVPDENPMYSVQGGEVESKGYEISINASPVEGLNIIGGYSNNESKVVKGAPSSSFSEEGRRPAEAGPEHVFNIWARYMVTKGNLKGLGVGFGGNAASERLIMDSGAVGQFALPAYKVFNASIFYQADLFNVTLKVDNLTDETYFKGWSTINPQRPRSVSASFSYRF